MKADKRTKKSKMYRWNHLCHEGPTLSLDEQIAFSNLEDLVAMWRKERAEPRKRNAPWYELLSDHLDDLKYLCAQMAQEAGENLVESVWTAAAELSAAMERGPFGREEISVIAGYSKPSKRAGKRAENGRVMTKVSTQQLKAATCEEETLERFKWIEPILLELRLPLSSLCSCHIPRHPRFKRMALALAKARNRDAKALALAKKREAAAMRRGGLETPKQWNSGYRLEIHVDHTTKTSWKHLDGKALIEKLKWWLSQKRQHEMENFHVRAEVR